MKTELYYFYHDPIPRSMKYENQFYWAFQLNLVKNLNEVTISMKSGRNGEKKNNANHGIGPVWNIVPSCETPSNWKLYNSYQDRFSYGIVAGEFIKWIKQEVIANLVWTSTEYKLHTHTINLSNKPRLTIKHLRWFDVDSTLWSKYSAIRIWLKSH